MSRHLASVVVAVFALLMVAPAYMDGDGSGGVWGAFYVCTPDRCGWWFCWPGEPCYPI
jgi:hypothetical protein